MSLLVRKVNMAKWEPHRKLKVSKVPGDAITCCMRTTANTLSLWEVAQDEEEMMIKEGVLALVTGPKQSQLESIDVVLLDSKELKKKKLEIEQKDEPTFVEEFAQAHWNISNLTYKKLGTMAKMILGKFSKGKVIRVTRMKVIDIVIEALKKNRLEFWRLSDKIQKAILTRCVSCGEDLESFAKCKN